MQPDAGMEIEPLGTAEKTDLISGVRESLLVLTPRDLLGIQQIGDGRHIGRDLVEIVIVHAKVVTGSRCNIVGLRGVGSGKVVCQENTLLRDLCKVAVVGSDLVGLISKG